MSEVNIFEQATRKSLRFKVANGVISTEDLWPLFLESLDTLARNLNKALKDSEEFSFIKTKTPANLVLELQFEVVKHIIGVKLQEKEDAKSRAEKAAKRDLLKDVLAKREEEELLSLSKEELLKQLETLK